MTTNRIDKILITGLVCILLLFFAGALGAHNACISEPRNTLMRYCVQQGSTAAACKKILAEGLD